LPAHEMSAAYFTGDWFDWFDWFDWNTRSAATPTSDRPQPVPTSRHTPGAKRR